jgi:hypothetical protein
VSALEYVGFAKLRPGRIHLFCPACKRKLSNMPRSTTYPLDPPTAVLSHVYCDCVQGAKDPPTYYLDAEGRFLCSYCGRHDCEDAGGDECDESLIYPLSEVSK